MENTHFFIAIPLPRLVREMVEEKVSRLKLAYPFKSWVHPLDYHITLAFLGKATSVKLDQLKASLTSVVGKYDTFQLQLNHIGTFGPSESPRVLWVGVERTETLLALQQDISFTCEQVGFSMEKRAYRPHLTLARKWKSTAPFAETQEMSLQQPLTMEVKDVVLFQTHINQSPKYEAIHFFNLK